MELVFIQITRNSLLLETYKEAIARLLNLSWSVCQACLIALATQKFWR